MKRLKIISFLLVLALLIPSCKKEEHKEQKTGNSIIEFYVRSILLKAPIDEAQQAINLFLPADIDIKSVKPDITISEGATIDPPSFQIIDLSNPVEFTVTAEDGNQKVYTVYTEQLTDTAFMIIDVQNGWTMDCYKYEEVLDNINLIADNARAAGKPVVYVYDYSYPDNYNGWELQICDAISPQNGDFVLGKKNTVDVFDGTTKVIKKLNELGVGVVILSGISSGRCVDGSCIGSLDRGYKVIMASDCHTLKPAGFDGEVWAADQIITYNTKWANKGAAVVKAEEITFSQ